MIVLRAGHDNREGHDFPLGVAMGSWFVWVAWGGVAGQVPTEEHEFARLWRTMSFMT